MKLGFFNAIKTFDFFVGFAYNRVMERLDSLVSVRENISRTKAQNLIKEGKVQVCGKVLTKPSFMVDENVEIFINDSESYVSRGAYKLKKALEVFDVSVENKVVLDMGASTGGFTQVALENRAKKVYSVDVGRGELARELVENSKVVNLEETDIRILTKEMVGDSQIVVGDLSFISLKHILPKINQLFEKIECVLLFKPQFECGKEIARKYRGVIKDRVVHKNLLKEFLEELKIYDYILSDITFSPIKGKSGNVEYLLHLNGKKSSVFEIDKVVEMAFCNAN